MSRKFELVSKYIGTEIEQNFIMPRRATKGSACYDIFNNTGADIVINPGEMSKTITTHLKIKMPISNVCIFYVRSSTGFKTGTRLANSSGILDHDFYNNIKNEGECFVKFRNPSNETVVIPAGEAMAQAMFVEYLTTDDDQDTVGGDRVGGIGSTTK